MMLERSGVKCIPPQVKSKTLEEIIKMHIRGQISKVTYNIQNEMERKRQIPILFY